MDCPHCGKAFHAVWNQSQLQTIPFAQKVIRWAAQITVCPACKNPTIFLEEHGGFILPFRTVLAYPTHTFRRPTPEELPADIRKDYEEACKVLPISEKASAALSRRCLQAILQGQGYAQKDLAQQIDALLKEADLTKVIPTALRQTVDAVRNFGNFSAHRITDRTTLQVIEVDPGEAEWCLEILEDMFDHYYVRPAQATARKAALDEKLAAAGKPRSK